MRSLSMTCRAALVVWAVLAAAVAGCGTTTPSRSGPTGCLGAAGDVALVASGRQHSPAARLDGDARRVVTAAIDTGHTVTVINLDGRPAVSRKFRFADLPNNSSRAEALDTATAEVSAALAALRADDPQVDDLAGLQLGADLVRDTRGTVLLMDSGLSTVAPADFTQPGVLAADPADLSTFLRTTGQSINLSDVAVGYTALGYTTAPQPPLPPALVANLQALYTRLAADSGARCSAVVSTPTSDRPVDSPLPVALVPIPPATPFTAHPAAVVGSTTVFDSATLHFRPDQAELLDPASADAALAPLIGALRAAPNTHITITGTCATGSGVGPNPVTLSTQRADTIARRLLTAGIAPDRITTRGVGTDFPEFQPDTDASGHLLPGPAAQNRTVRITVT